MKVACHAISEVVEQNPVSLSDKLLAKLNEIYFSLNANPRRCYVSDAVMYYILLCGVFNPKRSMLNHWEKYEHVFAKI